MPSAHSSRRPGERHGGVHRRAAVHLLLAFCIVHAAWLAAACTRVSPAVLAAQPQPLEPLQQLSADILAAVNAPGVQRGVWAVTVHSLARAEPLFELNPHTLLVPASAVKIVSVAAAAEAVGWDYRYDTTLLATGPIEGGALMGDLIVVGSGDPSLGGRGGFDLTSWVDALNALGVRRIEGRIIGDDDRLEEPRPQLAWAWDDLGYATGAIYGALNIQENRLTVTVDPGAAPGRQALVTVDPHSVYRPLFNRTITGARGSPTLLWPEQRPGETFLTIAGSIAADRGPARLLVSAGNPTFWFASVLRHRLQADGIEVRGGAYDIDDLSPAPDRDAATVLYIHRSPTFSEIAQPLLKDSINLYGEAALRLNTPPGAFPTNDAALEGLLARLASWGIPQSAHQIVDGSGLSRRNTITADALLTVLRRMHDATGVSPFVTGLPVAGVDGSLAGRLMGTAAHGNLRAKTGTMTNIRSLAGYVTTRDGEPLAFAIMVNNFEGTGAAALQAIDAIAVRLAEFSRSR